MTPETMKVAITQADDAVAVMSFVILGRGDVLPFGAEWADKAAAIWLREPTPANLEHEIDRTAGLALPIKGYRKLADGEVPEDRTFRNAWRDRAGRVEVDMPAARGLMLDKIRAVRVAALADLDAQWMRATGQGDKAAADAAEAERQKLRDLTDTVGVELAATPEDLKALWPETALAVKMG